MNEALRLSTHDHGKDVLDKSPFNCYIRRDLDFMTDVVGMHADDCSPNTLLSDCLRRKETWQNFQCTAGTRFPACCYYSASQRTPQSWTISKLSTVKVWPAIWKSAPKLRRRLTLKPTVLLPMAWRLKKKKKNITSLIGTLLAINFWRPPRMVAPCQETEELTQCFGLELRLHQKSSYLVFYPQTLYYLDCFIFIWIYGLKIQGRVQ